MFSVIGLIVVQLNIARCVYCIVVKHLVRLHCRINGYIYFAVTCGCLTDLVIVTFPKFGLFHFTPKHLGTKLD